MPTAAEEKRFVQIIDSTPLVSLDLILNNDQDQVLLGKRVNRPARGYWFVPGGRILKNEPLDHAISRISLTETGVEIFLSEARLLGAYEHFYEDNFLGKEGISTHYVVLAFRHDLPAGRRIVPDEQHSAMRWWPVEELLASPEVHPYTKRYFEGRPPPGRPHRHSA